MTALIFGLDLTINGTASEIMKHERAVKTAFLASAPSGTTAEIVISGNQSIIDGQPDLYARIPRTSLFSYGAMVDLNAWLAERPTRYDVMVFSYIADRSWDVESERILRNYGITVFCPMNNVATSGTGFYERVGNNIFYIGTGTTENTAQRGYRMTGYTTASPSSLTSFTTARSAGLYLHCKAQGGTLEQVRKRFLQNFAGYPDKTVQNGYGSVPTTYTDTTPDLLPPASLWAYPSSMVSGSTVTLYFAPFYPQTQDGFRLYANGIQVAQGSGTQVNDGGWIGTADLRTFTHTPTVNTTYAITAYQGDTESDITLYASDSVTVVTPPTPTPPPEPEPEPDIPPVNPNPNVFLIRSTQLTGTTDGGGDVTQWRYRTDIGAEWTSHSGSTFSITADPTKTYEVQARVSSGGVFTDWSVSSYSTATATPTIRTFSP
jgi:hypothetical protein